MIPDYENVTRGLDAFYRSMPIDIQHREIPSYYADLDREADAMGTDSPYRLKPIQYRYIAETFTPRLFPDVPFYFELGTKCAYCDGGAYRGGWHPGGWLLHHQWEKFEAANPAYYRQMMSHKRYCLYTNCGPYVDQVHYCYGYTNAFQGGLSALYERCQAGLEAAGTEREREFFACALEGFEAAHRIQLKFSERADEMLRTLPGLSEKQRADLARIRDTAERVPWEAPKTFYEGLNSLAFLREVSGSLEGVGQNAFGRPDVLLLPLYEKDLAEGRLTKDEAYELISKFLLIWDRHYDRNDVFADNVSHEYEISLNVGGCDGGGNEVFNDLTAMFIAAHSDNDCIYPKLLCRFGAKSSKDYLALINRYYRDGRSNIMMVSDDSIIPALVKAGYELSDARNYIASGCWDVTVEGCEKRPCGEYLNLLRPLEMSIHMTGEEIEREIGLPFDPIENAQSFEEVYAAVLGNIRRVAECKFKFEDFGSSIWSDLSPSPFYSSALTGCLEKRKDCTAGGAKYAPGCVYYGCFGNLVDSLLAIRSVCFERKLCTPHELCEAMRADWEGYEALRLNLLRSPFWGDESSETAALAKRLHKDLYAIADRPNFYGGRYLMGYLNYTEFSYWGKAMKATPDGRKAGQVAAHGIEPCRFHPIESPTAALNSLSVLDYTDCAACSCINVILPKKMTPEALEGFERAFARCGLQALQLNCADREELLDAQLHPEDHGDLIVRVCGFSAKFVSLSKYWQDEFISRNFYR